MAEIFQGIAAVLWPLIVIVLIVILIALFKPSISSIIDSAKSRKVSLKLGGQEITLEALNDQQSKVVADIQSRLVEVEKKIKGESPRVHQEDVSFNAQEITILWVDDSPQNNVYYVKQLSDMGLTVDIAISTYDGIRRFKQRHYTLVISDIGRREKEKFNYTAGLDFLKAIRTIDKSVPFILFTTSSNVKKYSSEAEELGVTFLASSWAEVAKMIFN